MKENFFGKYKNIRQLSLALALYSSTSIFGPLIIIGGIGYWLDRVLNTRPWLLIVGVFIAFVITNVLLFKKVVALMEWINKQKELAKEKKENEIKKKIEEGK